MRDGQFLLDTNVISHVIKEKTRADDGVRRFFELVDEERMFLSVFTIAELQQGIDAVPRAQTRAALEQRLNALCLRFQRRIIDVDVAFARSYGHLQAAMRKKGRPAPVIDTLIATAASIRGLVLATAAADFQPFADLITIYNPRTEAIIGPNE